MITQFLANKIPVRLQALAKLPKINNLNIFHTNINGLESKLDNLHEFISGSHHKLDILAITETSEQENVGFLNNIEIKGYKIFHTASKTSKGGTALYVSENVNSIERIDLNTSHDEFEGTWVEIEKLRECLKIMTLNSDYVSGILANRICKSTRSIPELTLESISCLSCHHT